MLLNLRLILCACRAKEERKRQRYRAKSLYQHGVWNIHTVTMGGLGEDPDGSSSDEEGREKQHHYDRSSIFISFFRGQREFEEIQ